MQALLGFLLRVLLVAAGLVFAASALVVSLLLLALWSLRALWLRLTGRPVAPLVMGLGGRAAFDAWMRRARAAAPSRTPRADAADGVGRHRGEVTDVEARPAGSEKH